MTKAELGTKRLCPNCGARYYDLNHEPILCPRCGTEFEVAVTRARPQAAAAKPPKATGKVSEAYKAWRGAAAATIDDAHMRYFIVHMHRFLDPAHEDHSHS